MRIIGDELKERNRYIGLLNRCEADINYGLCKLPIKLENPFTLLKQKTHEIEDLFHNKEMEFYTQQSPLGKLIKNYLLWYFHDMIEIDLIKITDFELAITKLGIRLPIKNPFIDNYNKKCDEIKNFKIDDTLPKKFAKYATKEDLSLIFFIDDDLIKLGYSDLAKNVINQTLEEIAKRKISHQKKKIRR